MIDIEKEFKKRQQKAKNLKKSRIAEIERIHKGFNELNNQLKMEYPKIPLLALKGQSNKEKILDLKKQITDILIKNSYPKDYLENVYECPICKDTGEGNCDCMAKLEALNLVESSGYGDLIKNAEFKNFDLKYYKNKKQAENALKIAKEFVSDMNKKNIFLNGTVGTGKTFLSACITKELSKKGIGVIYKKASEIFRTLNDDEFGRLEDSKSKLKEIFDSKVLVIDDLGTEFLSGKNASKLYEIIERRLLNGVSTIISTNFTKDEIIENYTDRVYSRIKGNYEVITLVTEDIRCLKR